MNAHTPLTPGFFSSAFSLLSKLPSHGSQYGTYNTCAPAVYMFPLARATASGGEEHTPLALRPDNRRFCVFSLACSPSHTDLLCGSAFPFSSVLHFLLHHSYFYCTRSPNSNYRKQ